MESTPTRKMLAYYLAVEAPRRWRFSTERRTEFTYW